MRLTIFNGSPKHGGNNTEIMLNKFAEGFLKTEGNACSTYKLNELNNINEAVKLFEKSEYILLAFPLYVYSMPAGVKEFIEALEPISGGCSEKKIGFLVQYGFREAVHARALEKYLEKLALLLKCEYLGTIIKGGCDGLAKQPDSSGTRKILSGIYEIGKLFGETGTLNKELLNKFSKPETQNMLSKVLMKSFVKLANKYYWGAELKKNGVFDQSFAQPYKK